MGDLHDDMVGVERVQIVDQPVPAALLDRLAAIVAETEMDRRQAAYRVEHPVDRLGGPLPFLRRAGQVGLVDLHHVGIEMTDLFGQHVGDRQGERRRVRVMPVDQGLGQHVRPGQRELQRRTGQPPRHPAGAGQVEMAGRDRSGDDARRPAAELHAGLGAEAGQLVEADLGGHPAQRPDEIFDHAVGFGMVRIEAIEFAVAHQVDAGQFLGVQHDPRGVGQRLFRRALDQPVRRRIGADHRRPDSRAVGAHCRPLLAIPKSRPEWQDSEHRTIEGAGKPA